tara:strand:- start:429 stop:1505 length:1077 start_codon:yes stop_codon:yes gene_type:complete
MNLIIPCAGESSRFPGTRPKWMLTQPDGQLMVVSSLSGLDLEEVSRVYLIVLQKHLDEYKCHDGIKEAFGIAGLEDKLEIVILEESTTSQPETVALGIRKANIKGPIFIKDCDGYFKAKIRPKNEVSVFDLADMELVHAANKSYVICDEHGLISNIAEKTIISSTFCVGGYSFENASSFIQYYESLKDYDGLYVSHIIYQMMLDEITFEVQRVRDYVDWGTLKEWALYKEEYATLFVDIDGVLVQSSSKYFSPKWGETAAISSNAQILRELYDSGKVQIILTTARDEQVRELTEEQLERLGIKYHRIVFGLLHSKRIIINDYAATNPYKSCDAINIRRNSSELTEMLKDCLKSNLKGK